MTPGARPSSLADLARPGLLLGVSGPSGSGKTQLAMQLAARASSRGARVFFQDISGSLRPERLEQMGADAGLVTVHRATNVSEQLAADGGGASLLVSDDAADLISFEYPRASARRERERLFYGHVRRLALAAHGGKAAAVFCSGPEYEDVLDLFSHVRVRLWREPAGHGGPDARRCSCSTAFAGWGGGFEIRSGGLSADNNYLLGGLLHPSGS